MASIVTITAPSEIVKCDREGRAQQVFNVSNSTGRALRVGVKVLVDDRAQEPWFTVGGPVEQDLAENVTAQVSIGVQVPPDSPPGKYPFRLLVFSTAAPGEEYTEGPTVAIEVPPPEVEAPPKREERKKMPLWIPFAAVVVLLIGGLAWAFWPTGVKVPGLVGKDLKEAEQLLSELGLKSEVVGKQTTGEQDPNTIWHQDPNAGKRVAKESAVSLILAAKLQTSGIPTRPGTRDCPRPYRGVSEDGRCVWSCSEGTKPDPTTNQCICQSGLVETGKDRFGRRICRAQT